MRVIAKIFIILTALSLVCLVFTHVLTSTVTNDVVLSKQLSSAGVYELGAKSLQDSVRESLKAANVTGGVTDEILATSITSTSVSSAAQPLVKEFSQWIVAESGSLNLVLDLTGIKSQIVREAKLKGSIETSFVATREVPDELRLLPKGDTKNNYSGLQQAYKQASAALPILLVMALGGIALLVLLALRLPHKRMAWPGWALVAAAVTGIIIVYSAPVFLSATVFNNASNGVDINRVGIGLVRGLLDDSRVYWYGLAAVGAGLIAVSMPLARRYKK